MKEFFRRLLAFLNRDVCSFFRRSPNTEQLPKAPDPPQLELAQEPEPEPAPLPPLPLLLNPVALDRIAFRREILDWRDSSVTHLDVAAHTVLKKFSNHIVTLLDDEPILRRIKPRKTNEVLAADFHNEVTLRIRAKIRECDKQLDEIMGRHGREQASSPRLISKFPAKRIGEIADCGFKPSNRKLILDAISRLVFGPESFFDSFYQTICSITIHTIDEV